ncbi:LytTR family DNA-binding domain-containing protein [Niabella yanshanensis]|uniref:LytTR family DNA-binding domain-containing protein n=1 Tax=Niabella yanshanensis TaxID=577386 RepID=A0ABZ0W4G7_9BACT|nr:LytTR family DNA-binding domain-containing protein [Niabella yanshanensis]WQD36986.1 LytTR family DNA-binding domain-containing protein [Niabella yanshanensis]
MHWKILNEPFPINTWKWYRLRGLGFGLFVFLFLFLFQPFSLNLFDTKKLLYVTLVYGAATGAVILCGGWIFSKWITPKLDDEKWTLGKQIMWNVLLMVFITLLNVYVTQLMHQTVLPLWWWLVMLKWVLMLGVLPVAVAELIAYNQHLRHHLKTATQLSRLVRQPPAVAPGSSTHVSASGTLTHQNVVAPSNEDNGPLILTGDNQGEKLELLHDNLLAVQALDNYVNVFWEADDQLRSTLLRNTLTNIAEQVSDAAHMYRSHRSWLVNVQRVARVDGNAQGLKLSVELMDQQVPVSRSNIPGYRQLTELQHQAN